MTTKFNHRHRRPMRYQNGHRIPLSKAYQVVVVRHIYLKCPNHHQYGAVMDLQVL